MPPVTAETRLSSASDAEKPSAAETGQLSAADAEKPPAADSHAATGTGGTPSAPEGWPEWAFPAFGSLLEGVRRVAEGQARTGELSEAQGSWSNFLVLVKCLFGEGEPRAGGAISRLARLLLQAQRAEDAVAFAKEALMIFGKAVWILPEDCGDADEVLGDRILGEVGFAKETLRLARKALGLAPLAEEGDEDDYEDYYDEGEEGEEDEDEDGDYDDEDYGEVVKTVEIDDAKLRVILGQALNMLSDMDPHEVEGGEELILSVRGEIFNLMSLIDEMGDASGAADTAGDGLDLLELLESADGGEDGGPHLSGDGAEADDGLEADDGAESDDGAEEGDGNGPQALVRDLRRARRALGPGHPETLAREIALAEAQLDRGSTFEAARRFRKAMEGLADAKGPEAGETLEAKRGLARAILAGGDCRGATALFRELHSARKAASGPGSVEELLAASELGEALGLDGDPSARALLKRASDGLAALAPGSASEAAEAGFRYARHLAGERGPGVIRPEPDETDLKAALSLYAAIRSGLKAAGRGKGAEAAEAILSEADLMAALGRNKMAEAAREAALAAAERALGPDAPLTLLAGAAVGESVLKTAPGRASDLFAAAQGGIDGPAAAGRHAILARLRVAELCLKGDTAAGLALLASIAETLEEAGGHRDLRAAGLRVRIGRILMENGESEAALGVLRSGAEAFARVRGERDPFVRETRLALGLARLQDGNSRQAERELRALLDSLGSPEASEGGRKGGEAPEDAAFRADVMHALGRALAADGSPGQAAALFAAELALRERTGFPDERLTLRALASMAEAQEASGDAAKALELHGQAYSRRLKALGARNPETAESREAMKRLSQGK
ncbi:MAG: hypothetical protein LBR80_17975 [Deltaproteobacteria bacterium]|jgi:hypothetical protein|nr:hypothetical protein [Deltaproteobacteria bacterium]